MKSDFPSKSISTWATETFIFIIKNFATEILSKILFLFQVVVVFYVAVVVLLVGTNLRTGRWKKKGAKFKKHVVEYQEGEGATNKIVSDSNEQTDKHQVVDV